MNPDAKVLRPAAVVAAGLLACACCHLSPEFERSGPGGLLFENSDAVALWTPGGGARDLLTLEGGGLGGLHWSPNRGHFVLATNFDGVPLLRIATAAGRSAGSRRSKSKEPSGARAGPPPVT